MAKNISPLMNHESEVHGLVAWSVLPTRILCYLSLLIAVQQLGFGVLYFFSRNNLLLATWHSALSVTFLVMAWQLSLFSKHSQKYLNSEENSLLARALSYVGGFWISYMITLFFSVAPLVAFLVRNLIGIDYQQFAVKSFLWVPAVWIVFGLSWLLAQQHRSVFSQKNLTQCVETFANKNVSKTMALTVVSVAIGLLWIWAYFGDALLNTSLDHAAVALSGAAYLLIGGSVGFVWRAVREIQRNPSLIYFERTMEKLNFFWLSACIGFIIILIGNFF